MLQCADRFQSADSTDFMVGSLFAVMDALTSAGTEPTSLNDCLLAASALHDRFLRTLAVTCFSGKQGWKISFTWLEVEILGGFINC